MRWGDPGAPVLRAFVAIALFTTVIVSGLLSPLPGGLLASESYTSGDSAAQESSVDCVQIGLGGSVSTEIRVAQLRGESVVLIGTSKGLYIVAEGGGIQRYISTPGSVSDISMLNDTTGDGQQEIVVAVDDTNFPNIRCYDGYSGKKIWQFSPKQAAFLEDLLWTDIQTSTFDVETINDVNADGYQDIAATSGYYLYLLNGQTGEQIWRFKADDNLWQVRVVPDVDGDGKQDLVIGAQTGSIYVVSGAKGNLIWEEKLAEECTVFDDGGNKWVIDRSIWDIVPIKVNGREKVIVGSEDGKVRLIDLKDKTCAWETVPLIEYSSSLQYQYYQQKNNLPTGPGDSNFFNLRVSMVDDVSGDGIGEILASTYVGQKSGTGNQGYAGTSGLFLIDSASGEVIWKKPGLDLENMASVETAHLDGKQVILLPQEKSGSTAKAEAVSIQDGEATETLEITSTSSTGTSEYWVKEFGDGSFILVSDYEDLLCVSSQGEVLWHYPRINDVAVEKGDFTGDATQDLFVWSKQQIGNWGDGVGARILYVIDGATREKAWSYEIPYEELSTIEGIAGIQVSPDINGDGKQDIVGFACPRSAGETGEGFAIMAFSGRDGSILLDQPVVTQDYYGLWDQLYKAKNSSPEEFKSLVGEMLSKGVKETYHDAYERLDERPYLKALVDDFVQQILTQKGEYNPDWLDGQVQQLSSDMETWGQGKKIYKQIESLDIINVRGEIAFIVGCRQDIFLISPKGELLWTKTNNPWVYEDPFFRLNPTGMETKAQWDTCYQSPGDVNGDGVDDLVACDYSAVYTLISAWEEDRLDFRSDPPAQSIFKAGLKENTNPHEMSLVDDIDGDGIREVSFFVNRENRPRLWRICSPDSGKMLIEREWEGVDNGCDFSTADFNNDGYLDPVFYWRRSSDYEGRPLVEVLSGKDGNSMWQFTEFQGCGMFDQINLRELMPVTTIPDLNGDGIAELALIKFLPDQPGARVVVYDVVNNQLLKDIAIEKFDENRKWDRRWQPGAFIEPVADFNQDGVREIAVLSMIGETGAEKEVQLMVVDLVNEREIAEFRIAGSGLIDTGAQGNLVMVGLSGELYFLDLASNLRITSPGDGDTGTSPLRIQWEGADPGALNLVFIDGIEVARTNETEVTVAVARGEHELMVRSMDEYGRDVSVTATFTVKKGAMIVSLAWVAMVVLALVAISPVLRRVFTRYRRKGIRR